MNETMPVQQQISAIKRSAAKREKAATEVIGTASVGDVVRQGDLYLVCLENLPPGKRAASTQLAPGTTQGSRHVADGHSADACVVNQCAAADVAAIINRVVNGGSVPRELVGPVLRCTSETTITHPEHGHKVLPSDSVWAVVYQRAYADEIRRVQD